jgi:hypothetical protein
MPETDVLDSTIYASRISHGKNGALQQIHGRARAAT